MKGDLTYEPSFELDGQACHLGGYFKLCGICTVVGTAIAAVELIVFMEPAWWKATKDFVKRLFDR